MKVPPLNKSEYLVNTAKNWSMRNFITKLDKPGAILPVVLLEATVTGGRTYQAYQRDGFVEARERVTEESLGAVFWLFGATMFGKLFDKMGQKFMKVPKNMPDVGKDVARSSFDNFVNMVANVLKISPEKAESLRTKLARYSVGKTAASIITACIFIGCVVPKLNQAITKHIFGKINKADPKHEKAPDPYKTKMTIKDIRNLYSAKEVSINAVENFKASQEKAKVETNVKKNHPSFKGGADSLLRIVQNFEQNAVWKLMGTDVGTVTGRTANARNNDERVEIMFRDISSIYFYCFSVPAIVAFMNRKDSFGGLNTKLNPRSAGQVHNYLVEAMSDKGVDKMSAEEFKKFALGTKDFDKDLYDKAFSKKADAAPKKVFFGLFNKKPSKEYQIINLSDFENLVDSHYADKTKADKIKALAREMSTLQPEKAGMKILTESQVEDVLRGGVMRKPEFMKKVINQIFEKDLKKPENPLTNKYKYISLKDIEDRRSRILGYAEALVQDAEKKNTDVNWQRMKQLNKRNLAKNGMFMGLAMGVSALFLSTIIPKAQYYITYLRTGKNTFPGVENMEQKK